VRKRKGPWIYKIDQAYVYHPKSVTIRVSQHFPYMTLLKETNAIIVHAGYAWDGCSYKFNVLDLFVWGSPDGRCDIHTGKPKTYYASLVHDALTQYLDEIDLTDTEVHTIFAEMLQDFKLRRLYIWAVKVFGPRKA